MKKVILLVGVSLFLVGCSPKMEETKNSTTEISTTESSKEYNSESPVDNNEVTKGPLLEVGQWTIDEFGSKIELKQISTEKKSVMLDELKITIVDVKTLAYSGEGSPNDNFKLTYRNNDLTFPFTTIQIRYNIENTADADARISGADSIVIDSGQQLDRRSGLSDSCIADSFNGKSNKDFVMSGVITNERVEDIRVRFGPTLDKDGLSITLVSDNIDYKL